MGLMERLGLRADTQGLPLEGGTCADCALPGGYTEAGHSTLARGLPPAHSSPPSAYWDFCHLPGSPFIKARRARGRECPF